MFLLRSMANKYNPLNDCCAKVDDYLFTNRADAIAETIAMNCEICVEKIAKFIGFVYTNLEIGSGI